jgi:catechol 2,3-dioxygenase-like lactoylglutathione lyase family enzyme
MLSQTGDLFRRCGAISMPGFVGDDRPPTAWEDPGVFNHVGQCTNDLDRATRFYVELLGFEVERELQIPDEYAGPLMGVEPPVDLTARYLRHGDLLLELMSFAHLEERPPRVLNEPGLTHLSVSVDDFEGTVERVESYGGEVLIRLPNAVMIRDPDGQRLEILTADYPEWVRKHGGGSPSTQG